MARFAALANPTPSHLMTIMAFGRELLRRGHAFTLFHVPEVEPQASSEGIPFCALPGERYHLPPPSALLEALRSGRGLSSLEMLRLGIRESRMLCEELPPLLSQRAIDCLIADETVPAGRSVAERANIPFISVYSGLPISSDPVVPPPSVSWRFVDAPAARWRNRAAAWLTDAVSYPVLRVLNAYRRQWNLNPHRTFDDLFSPRLQICQMVKPFDFPRSRPASLRYVGPFRREGNTTPVGFPFERLDGRPLVYVSLGTIVSGSVALYQTIAESCVGRKIQLVISLGNSQAQRFPDALPGNPIVVQFAPQPGPPKKGGLNDLSRRFEFNSRSVDLWCSDDRIAIFR